MELTSRFAHVWWVGFKVFCRWLAFGMVLTALWVPAEWLTDLIGNYAGSIIGTVVMVLVVPIIFYLVSRYLLLLGDNEQTAEEATERPVDVGARRGFPLRTKIVISTIVAYISGSVFALSPDPFTGLVLGAAAAVLCGVSLLILSRFQFVKSASSRAQTLICVLVCLAAMLASLAFTLARIYG